MEGRFVDSIPIEANYRSPWDKYALQAQSRPNTPLIVDEDGPVKLYKNLKMRKNAPFVTPDGHIEVNMRDSYVNKLGTRHGIIYVTWHPAEDGKETA